MITRPLGLTGLRVAPRGSRRGLRLTRSGSNLDNSAPAPRGLECRNETPPEVARVGRSMGRKWVGGRHRVARVGRSMGRKWVGGRHRSDRFSRWSALATLGAVCIGFATPALASPLPGGNVVLKVLSTRADLVSGGTARLEVGLPAGTAPSSLSIDLDGTNVASEFALRQNHKIEGLLSGLRLGANTLTARLPDGRGAPLTIT